jgi:hypothetical protein
MDGLVLSRGLSRTGRAVALAVVVVALAFPAAQAEFGTPVTLSGQNAEVPQVGVDANGDAVVVWRRLVGTNTRIQSRARSAAGVLGSIETLSDPGQNADLPQIAVNAGGNAVVVWQRSDGANTRIQARALSAAGVLGPVLTLSAAGRNASNPQVAVDADGNAVAVWQRFDGTVDRIQARALSAAGAVGQIQTLSPAGRDTSLPQIAFDADRNAVIVWRGRDATHDRIQARVRSAAGALSPIQNVSRVGQNTNDPQVAVDANGNAVVVWHRTDIAHFQIQARARSAAGVLGPIRTLSQDGATQAQVGMDGAGNALAVWRRFNGIDFRIEARALSAAGVLGPIHRLSPAGQEASDPQVAVGADGNAVAVWHRSISSANFRIQGRTRSAAGVLGPLENISGADASFAQVVLDADGDAVAVWERFDGTNFRIEAATGP